ncbi:serine hydrolase domain-containing protein [uncultured Tenacibaculum sp.]|uniref:serine hydrolase domain-containing protein n=1 Tax=uncultured Tenacibaculum sp. TaxID=174713 RepID=UPI002607A5E2|nr:serine hydrolase domain-containing protein [uncultured Tenacibaculum sp.]
MRTLLLIFLSVHIITCAQNNRITKGQKKQVDKLFSKWNKPNSPGMAIGVVSNGKMIYSKGYGLANLEHNISNSPKTAFNIASNGKQFTAAAIILLSIEGKLALNQSIKDFFPELPNYFEQITIINLLHHTSGLRDFSQITYLSGLRPYDYYNDEDIFKWIKNQKALNFIPGEKFLYSNSNYWLLGQIVEKISGISLAEFAKKEIFSPLKMDDTSFINNNSIIIKNRASGYYYSRRRSGFRAIVSTLEHTGNGGVYTTVNDLRKWTDAFYNKTILNADFWKLMTAKGTLNNGREIEYACALEIKNYKGLETIEHGGRAPGYLSDIINFPKENFTVIVLTNATNTNATQLGYQIANIFLKDKFKSSKKSKEKVHKTITLKVKELNKHIGAYWNANDSYSREIKLKNDTLFYTRSPRNSNPLVAISKNTFKMIHTPPELNVLVSFADNNIMTFIENNVEVASFKKYKPANYTNIQLEKFTGKYYSEEIDTEYELKQNKKGLQLFINGRRTVPLFPIMRNVFNSPMALFKFNEVDGQIKSFTVSTPRVKKILFKKMD